MKVTIISRNCTMVKVPRTKPHSLPYPTTPTSPLSSSHDPTPQNEATDVSNTSPGQFKTRVDGWSSELPPALQVGQHNSSHLPNDIPPSHATIPSDLTPRSSSESQRYQDFAPSTSMAPTSQSNNPYLWPKHGDLDNSLSALSKDESSTGVWADDSVKVLGSPYDFHSQRRSCLSRMLLSQCCPLTISNSTNTTGQAFNVFHRGYTSAENTFCRTMG